MILSSSSARCQDFLWNLVRLRLTRSQSRSAKERWRGLGPLKASVSGDVMAVPTETNRGLLGSRGLCRCFLTTVISYLMFFDLTEFHHFINWAANTGKQQVTSLLTYLLDSMVHLAHLA